MKSTLCDIASGHAVALSWVEENAAPASLGPAKIADQDEFSSSTLPPDPHPAREYYIAPPPPLENASLDAEQLVVVQKLTHHGVTASIASDLVRRLPARCEQQLRYLPFYPAGLKNPAGYLRKAIENDFAPPKRFLDAEARAENQRAEMAKRDPVADRQAALRAEIANRELLETLPASMRYVLELEVDQKLTQMPFCHMKPEIKRTVRATMILEAAKLARFGDHGAVA